MGFGLTTFHRLMEKCMGEFHLRECFLFIDDILVFSKSFEEHLNRLQSLFSKLQLYGLKLKPSKCEVFKSSVTYLGHVVSEEGISTDPEKTEACPYPHSIKELCQFLGFVDYYRRFVKDYSKT